MVVLNVFGSFQGKNFAYISLQCHIYTNFETIQVGGKQSNVIGGVAHKVVRNKEKKLWQLYLKFEHLAPSDLTLS